MRLLGSVVAIALSVTLAEARNQDATVQVRVAHEGRPVPDASVVVNGRRHATDAAGTVIATVSAGTVAILVVKQGFVPVRSSLTLAPGQTQEVEVALRPVTFEEEITVSATRTDKRLEDQPLRVEVLAREEIEEKMLMTPGDIVMMLNETGGLRVQATSPSLGASSVRIQGMRGRYTRFLSDGLPLFGEVGGLGLLQIPPMDLGQVEVIKGVASSLYGAGAMGGVVNLLSRRRRPEPQRELLINRSTRGATDAVSFLAGPLSPRWGVTLLGSGHWQQQSDVDGDAWSDLPRYARGVLRPRLFWDNGGGSTFFATTGVTVEDRDGGTAPGVTLPAGFSYAESLETRRLRRTMIKSKTPPALQAIDAVDWTGVASAAHRVRTRRNDLRPRRSSDERVVCREGYRQAVRLVACG
jgi:outer membrane receptor for ferrienterochelin and colicins